MPVAPPLAATLRPHRPPAERRRRPQDRPVGRPQPAIAQQRTKHEGRLPAHARGDGQIWTGQQIGPLRQGGLELELVKFTTGLELFQAMIGGSLDMLSTGAVVSNFPARGQGKVFLINNIEYATAQLWVRDEGIKTWPT
jgi:NitT/TauT family transport system substrate-binding protein